MKRFDTIFDVAEICHRKGVTHAILCPGSRCAPLTIAFSRHPGIKTFSIPDERSAGFIALGIAQQTKAPVVIICTSGTATFNFGPSVAEAFFQEIPLLIFTADRPAEWVGQQDGQTIFQTALYGRHVKGSYETLPDTAEGYDEHVNRIVNEGINKAVTGIPGPIHINFPFSEPLYPENTPKPRDVRTIEAPALTQELTTEIISQLIANWNDSEKILLMGGQHDHNDTLVHLVSRFAEKYQLPVVSDITGNLHACINLIGKSDLFLAGLADKETEELRPDLLITFGKSILSKSMKLFLRKHKSKYHWHIREEGPVADTFRSLTRHITMNPVTFFETFHSKFKESGSDAFLNSWLKHEGHAKTETDRLRLEKRLSEPGAVSLLLQQLPEICVLHLANSMSVRYANYVGLESHDMVEVYSNRGTSGIDGCTSTALGHALSDNRLHILITGDLAFFYDRNAFWHNYPAKNLRILLINNHGGLIFDVIDGPSSVPEKDEYFVTHQALDAQSLCSEFGLIYMKATTHEELNKALPRFLNKETGTAVLEINALPEHTRTALNELKLKIRQNHAS